MLVINLEKAKLLAHGIRRAYREEEFAPYDAIIMKQIPGKDHAEAEAKRQEIRDKYVVIQSNIDSAASVEELTAVTKSIIG